MTWTPRVLGIDPASGLPLRMRFIALAPATSVAREHSRSLAEVRREVEDQEAELRAHQDDPDPDFLPPLDVVLATLRRDPRLSRAIAIHEGGHALAHVMDGSGILRVAFVFAQTPESPQQWRVIGGRCRARTPSAVT